MKTVRITVNEPHEWRHAKLKFCLLMLLAGCFGITIIGIPVAVVIFTYAGMRLGAHHLWLESQR